MSYFNNNNFDFIRFIAALQVILYHGFEHFNIQIYPSVLNFISLFPGVPIFFVISGFLISASFERKSSYHTYFKNRFLRIYPGLWMCFFLSLLIVFTLYKPHVSISEFFRWSIAQLTVGQFYNPSFLRKYGIGVLNGSLWSIPIELQFYISLPFIYYFLNRLKWNTTCLLLILCVLIAANQIYIHLMSDKMGLFLKLFGVSVIPFLYMFIIGIILQRNFNFVIVFLKGKAILLLIIYLVVAFLTSQLGLKYNGNYLNPFSAFLLALLTVSFGYTFNDRISNIFRGNDISYGMYIYHMVILNVLIYLNFFSPIINFVVMLIMTFTIAFLSWKIIEKPFLSLKSSSIRTN